MIRIFNHYLHRSTLRKVFFDLLLFVGILVVALVYAWRKGVLRWE